MGGALLSRKISRLFTYWRHNSTVQTRTPLGNENALIRAAREIGDDWKASSYYDSAERYMQDLWEGIIWPVIKDCDFSCVVDLAAGHGRNTERLKEFARKIYVVDINEENIQFCRQRFAGDDRIAFLKNDGVKLDGIADGEATLVYCFDAMVHFDSDIVRSYLQEFGRVLKPRGHGFCHHSNYEKNPGGNFRDNPAWRNFMSQSLFRHYCAKEGLEVVRSQIIDWDGTPGLDCVTLLRKL